MKMSKLILGLTIALSIFFTGIQQAECESDHEPFTSVHLIQT